MFKNMDGKNKVICVKSSQIGMLTLLKISFYILLNRKCKIAIDMKFVKNIKESFLGFVKKHAEQNKISLININSELMALMNIKQYDKYVYIYSDVNDYFQNSRAIVNRNFRIL